MTVYEVLTVAVILIVGAAATLAIYLGLLNWIGGFFVVRCDECHHLTFSSANQSRRSCAHCRHPILMHPIYSAHHSRAPGEVRVVGDRLKF
jgi:ribosomal protein S27E